MKGKVHPWAKVFLVISILFTLSIVLAGFNYPNIPYGSVVGSRLAIKDIGGGGGVDCTDSDEGSVVDVFGITNDYNLNGGPDRCMLSNCLNCDETAVQTCSGTGCHIFEGICNNDGEATYQKLHCDQGCNGGVCASGNAPATNQGVLDMLNNCEMATNIANFFSHYSSCNQFCNDGVGKMCIFGHTDVTIAGLRYSNTVGCGTIQNPDTYGGTEEQVTCMCCQP